MSTDPSAFVVSSGEVDDRLDPRDLRFADVYSDFLCKTSFSRSMWALNQIAGESADARDELVEECGRIDVNTDERVGFSAPTAGPVGNRHAAGQCAGQLDVDGGRSRRHQIRIERHARGQRIVQMREVSLALVEMELEVEPHGVLEHP